MPNIHLTLATFDYDHIRDLTTGRVRAEGIDLTYLQLTVEEIFYRFTNALEWDVSEMSMGKYCSVQSQDDPPFTGIPVFPSRVFRQSSVFVKDGGTVSRPGDLAGKRVGIPEWSQTATIYARGWLTHQVGISLADVNWVQAGVNEPGRVEMAHLKLPLGVEITVIADRSLNDMLIAGEIDAMFSAHPPVGFFKPEAQIVRLFSDFRAVEEAYFHDTGIFPIMHTIAVRREVYDDNPWVLRNLMTAFEEAKARSIERLMNITAAQIAIPWGYDIATQMGEQVFGEGDYWPYGIELNRVTLDAFLQYCYEQGVCHRRLEPEDLYPKEVQSIFRL